MGDTWTRKQIPPEMVKGYEPKCAKFTHPATLNNPLFTIPQNQAFSRTHFIFYFAHSRERRMLCSTSDCSVGFSSPRITAEIASSIGWTERIVKKVCVPSYTRSISEVEERMFIKVDLWWETRLLSLLLSLRLWSLFNKGGRPGEASEYILALFS